MEPFDIAIIGGGINGCGCAADAALRGLSVVLLEKDDIASLTSSSSTKLIHGGLRYLEHYEFGLVKKALSERQRLLDLVPHLVHPQPFVLAYQKKIRPAWFIRLGLCLYDYLNYKNRLPKSKSLNKKKNPECFNPLKDEFTKAFLFYDAATDDSRLTLSNAMLAKNQGAHIRRNASVINIEAKEKLWELTILNKDGSKEMLHAKAIINATGPYVEPVAKLMGIQAKKMSLVQGSHILVPKIYEGKQGYLLQAEDDRVVFVIPYHGLTMIGTTEVLYQGDLNKITAGEEEITYLLKVLNTYFKSKLDKKNVIYTWSGVRPLLAHEGDSLSALSRDYYYEFNDNPLPSITIYSGKLTTYRQMAEEILNRLTSIFPNSKPCKTREISMPGSKLNSMDFTSYALYANKKYAWLPSDLLDRYLNTYGTCMERFLSQCADLKDMGKHFGNSLYQVEVDYLISEEFAETSDDILKRRTKLILKMDDKGLKKLSDYLSH